MSSSLLLPSTSEAYALRGEKLLALHSCPAASQPVVLAVCGSFNPIHNAHIKLYEAAKKALTTHGDYAVLGGFFSPVSDAYGKPGLKPAAVRVQVIEDAVRDHPELSVDTWECTQPTYTRTVYVLQQLEAHVNAWYALQEPDAMQQLRDGDRRIRVVLVCGADLFSSFWIPNCWPLHLLKLLLDTFPLVVVSRASGSGGGGSMHDVQQRVQSSPVLRESVDGETKELAIGAYDFTFAEFADPDDTSSTLVRDAAVAMAAAADAQDDAATEQLRAKIASMVPSGALKPILSYYGGVPAAA